MKKLDLNRLINNLVFPSIRIYYYSGKLKDICNTKMLQTFMLCLVESGAGSVTINGAVATFHKGDLLLLSPSTIIEENSASTTTVQLTIIMFSCIQLHKNAKGWSIQQPRFSEAPLLQISSNHFGVMKFINQLIVCYKERKEDRRVTLQYALSSVLLTIIKIESSVKETHENATIGMEIAIEYMNKEFINDIKVSKLAAMSGFSVNHFTKLFKKIMNKTPLEYVMELRMTRAKQLLTSKDKMKHVARQSGFKDEHYFSRVFKKTEGVAPTLFIKNKCHRIATLYYGIDDHLMVLGVRPVASLSYKDRVNNQSPLFQVDHESMKLSSIHSNYDRLMRMKPDLMLTSDRLHQDEAIKRIAPTAILGHSDSSGNMLAHIGNLLGREREAANWLEEYGQRKESLKGQIGMRWGNQNAYFIRVSSEFYRVYGKKNQTGNLLYEDLGLLLPSQFPEHKWAVDIQLHELWKYESDHIFLMVDPSEQSRKRLMELTHSEQWQSLRAVRQQHIYYASDLMFMALGSSSRMLAMNRIATQLGI